MDIYWIENKQKHGPITVPDIIARVQMGELHPKYTLGWHQGCEKWLPLQELPALADFLSDMQDHSKAATTAPDEPQDEIADILTQPEAPQPKLPPIPVAVLTQPSVARRMVARFTDCAIYAAVVMVLIYLLKVPFSEYLLFSQPTFWLPLILIEAYLLSNYGTTPGKRLMGLTVKSLMDGHNPAFRFALSRSFGVFILGMGCFIPLLSIIMMLIAAHMVRKGSLTLWDNRARTITLALPDKQPSIFLCILIIFISIQIVSYCMTPWLPDMMEILTEASPETAEWFNQHFPTQP